MTSLDCSSILVTGDTGSFDVSFIRTVLDATEVRRVLVYSRAHLGGSNSRNRQLLRSVDFHVQRTTLDLEHAASDLRPVPTATTEERDPDNRERRSPDWTRTPTLRHRRDERQPQPEPGARPHHHRRHRHHRHPRRQAQDLHRRYLIEKTARAWASLRTVTYGGCGQEQASKQSKGSLDVVNALSAGEVVDSESVRAIRLGFGLPATKRDHVLGLPVTRDVRRQRPASWDLIRHPSTESSPT